MNSLNEEWRDVAGFDGLYQVSNLGRVRSCDRFSSRPVSRKRFLRGKILKLILHGKGYFVVNLFASFGRTTKEVHRLVAESFLGDRPKGFHVNHIDGNKLNNCAENLEYCSPKENTQHAFRLGLCDTRIGNNHHGAKLKDADIPVIRDRLANGHTQRSIAKDYGVTQSSIGDIKVGVTWCHVK